MWYIDGDYVLHIRHSETYADECMQTYGNDDAYISGEYYTFPWYAYTYSITKVVFEDKVHFTSDTVANLFYSTYSLREIDGLENIDMSNITDTSNMFSYSAITSVDVSGWDTSNVTNMSNMFYYTPNLTEINGSGNLNVSSVTNMSYMFDGCSNLQSLDVSGWDTSSVTNMEGIFYNCSNLQSLDVSDWDTSSVTNMKAIFYGTQSLTEIKGLENWNTSASTTMEIMFYNCGISSLEPLYDWDVSNVTNMNSEFSQMKNLTDVDLSKWNAPSVTDMGGMFSYSTIQSVILPSNTVSAKYMNRVFYSCQYLTKPMLSNLVTTAVSSMKEMFAICYSLTELDLSSFDTATPTSPGMRRSVNVEDMIYMDIPTNLTKITLGPNVTLRENCNVWKTKAGVNGVAEDREVAGIYLANDGDEMKEGSYIGKLSDFYTYQNDATHRVDTDGNPISNVYRLCDVLTYDPNGGTWSDESSDVKCVYYPAGETCTVGDVDNSIAPTKDESNFIGWDRVKDNTGSLYNLKTTFSSSGWEAYTLYADWEGKDKVVYDTNDTSFANVKAAGTNPTPLECKFTIQALDGAPEPTKTDATVSFSGEGSQILDFGTITFTRTGTYNYGITQTTNADGWVNNNGTKIVSVTVSRDEDTGETSVSSVEGVNFYNWYMGTIRTENLTEQLKADANQKNHQQTDDEGSEESLYKSAEWTDKYNGKGKIDIVYNNTYSSAKSTTALYIYTNCTAHDFSSTIAKQNIQFLLKHYDTVIAVCSMKTKRSTDSGVTYEKHIFSSSDTEEANSDAIDAYLDTIYFTNDMHLSAAWQLSCFDACLDIADPDAVFFSFDGGRGYDDTYEVMTQEIFGKSSEEFDTEEYPEPKLKHYDKTLKKLAELMKKHEYYIMTPEGSHEYPGENTVYNTLETSTQRLKNMAYLAMMIVDPVTMSTKAGRDAMKGVISDSTDGLNIRDYIDENLFMTYGTEIYSYKQNIESAITIKVGERYTITDIIDPRFKIPDTEDIVITVPVQDSDGNYKVLQKDVDYVLTVSKETNGTKLTVKFLEWDGYPAKISVPIELNDVSSGFFNGNDYFDDTNVGEVTTSISDVVYNGKTQEEEEEEPKVTIQAVSPKLYLSFAPTLPTAGGIGTWAFTICGVMLMTLGILGLRRKKKYERKK